MLMYWLITIHSLSHFSIRLRIRNFHVHKKEDSRLEMLNYEIMEYHQICIILYHDSVLSFLILFVNFTNSHRTHIKGMKGK